MNQKYGTNIKLLARQKPFFETRFSVKAMSEDERLREIEKHTKALAEAWSRIKGAKWGGQSRIVRHGKIVVIIKLFS
ncbi:MAG: hypothetical protein ACUVTL_02065 [Thermoproteota archaeon]